MSDTETTRELDLQSILTEALRCAGLPLEGVDDLLAPLPSLPDLDFPELPITTLQEASPKPQQAVLGMHHECNRRSVKISLRIDARTLNAFKARAASKGKRYQSLINQALRDASASWDNTENQEHPVAISV